MSNYVLTLKLKTEKFQEDVLEKKFDYCRKIYNNCISELHKRYSKMRKSTEYKEVIGMKKGKSRNSEFNKLSKLYNLTEYSLHKHVVSMKNYFKVDSMTAQKLATRAFSAFQKYMFHSADKVNYIKIGEMYSIEGKTNKSGIKLRDRELLYNKMKIPIIVRKNDYYAEEALEDNIKFCRIIKKIIKGKTKWYVQLIIESIPPDKVDLDTGEIKRSIGKGDVGIDIGTSTIAISSKTDVKIFELADKVENIENEKRIIMRKMDRSKRLNNPNNYNEDKTIKKQGNKKVIWIKSKKYNKNQNILKELYRKQVDIRKTQHEIMANYIISLGDNIYVEKMNFAGLQKKSKRGRKRFGKSLANRAPAMLLEIINRKLKYHNRELIKINTWIVKASQYNHFNQTYKKKSLSERWNDFDGIRVQRDMYSAFLIMNVEDDLQSVNNGKCIDTFDNFLKLHNLEVKRLKGNKNLGSIAI